MPSLEVLSHYWRAFAMNALSIKRGAKKGSKQSKVHLSKRQVEKFIQEKVEETKRKEAVKRFGLTNERALDRACSIRRLAQGERRSDHENKKRTLNYSSTLTLYA